MSQPYDPQNPATYPPPPGGYPGQPTPPGYPPAYPASAPPYAPYPASAPPGYPYPASAPPGYPASAPPAYPGYPASAPPAAGYPYPVSATPASAPGYPPLGYPAPPPPKRNVTLFVIVGAGVLLALIAAVALLNRDGSNTRTPEATVNAYFSALERGDIDGMRALSCAQLQKDYDKVWDGFRRNA